MSTESPGAFTAASHYVVRILGNCLRCAGCGHRVNAHDVDIIEPTGLIRVTCGHCHIDLVIIEIHSPPKSEN
jgi:hypothetical protein